MNRGKVDTAHGTLAYMESGGQGPAVLFIHGNSSCKEMFGRQFAAPMAERYRFIGFDLPGHGESSNAPVLERTYSINGFASAAMALLDALGVEKAAVMGWSLGGHAALEMMARWKGTVATWITGTPPAGGADMAEAFLPSDKMGLTFQRTFTEEDARTQLQGGLGEGVAMEPWMLTASLRADGRFRPLMLQSAIEGRDLDGRKIAETAAQPLAVVTGGAEPYVNNAFLEKVTYRNLWDGKVHVLDGLGHAPFWQAPEVFNPLFERFLDEVC
ncbi:MAG: putative hydrolase, alpha/beta fold protein [Parvibaculum sp.]|uniref:alpha/beta fold hydrolase n=1 Tax=Parvibaculum sp. TaxID=2024848 RepID=UPI0035B79EBC